MEQVYPAQVIQDQVRGQTFVLSAKRQPGPSGFWSFTGSPPHGLTSSNVRNSATNGRAAAGSASICRCTCSSVSTRYTYMPALALVTSSGSSAGISSPVNASAARRTTRR